MTFHKLMLPAVALLAVAPVLSGTAVAQSPAARSQRAHNMQATTDMRSRLAEAVERVRVTEQHGKITPARSATLRTQLVRAQRDMARFQRRQGFVSAAGLASYDRLVTGIDAELSASANERNVGNDGLPSSEVTAFQRADARLHYRGARIEYDAHSCAFYQGHASNG